MSNATALLLVNGKSRQGGADFAPIRRRLEAHGLDLVEFRPGSAEVVARLIREHHGRVGRVIIGGGDGTLNCALEALIETGLPLGVLPLGTANDFARTLGLPLDPHDAAEAAAGESRRRIDVGCVNGRYFLNVASIGLSVQVTRALSRGVKRRWGVLGYGIALLNAMRQTRPFHVQARCDGKESRFRSIQVAIGNGRHYGGGMTIAVDASIDDSRLDLYSLQPLGPFGLLRLLPALRLGPRQGIDGITMLHGREIQVDTSRPMAINTDGEITRKTPGTFRVLPGALEVFVAPPATDGT